MVKSENTVLKNFYYRHETEVKERRTREHLGQINHVNKVVSIDASNGSSTRGTTLGF